MINRILKTVGILGVIASLGAASFPSDANAQLWQTYKRYHCGSACGR